MSEQHCVVIGGSHAAAQLTASLRMEGWKGKITMISAEPLLPYHRPPLSKTYLKGDTHIDELLIRPQSFYEQHDIHTMLGVAVTKIDREEKKLIIDGDAELHYDKLAITTGSRVRKISLPGDHLPGVYYLRDAEDVDNIRHFVGSGKKAVVVGGGYIGLETASALRKIGMEVTVLEALERVLQRVTAPEISAFYTRVHEEEGVKILTDMAISEIHGENRVSSVSCKDGTTLDADLVIIGVGIVPVTELAEEAGLEINNGIVVDQFAATADPDIVAAGDCTWHFNPIYDREIRLESVQNALDQAKVAAATICGKPKAYNTLPWFWSDQYDLKLQIAGLSQGFDQVVIRGDITQGRQFAAFYLKEGRLLAVDAINSPKEFMIAKRVLAGKPVNPDTAKLADTSLDIKDILS